MVGGTGIECPLLCEGRLSVLGFRKIDAEQGSWMAAQLLVMLITVVRAIANQTLGPDLTLLLRRLLHPDAGRAAMGRRALTDGIAVA